MTDTASSGLRHRPLTSEEFEKQADEISRDRPQQAPRLAYYVAGTSSPELKVGMHRAGHGWQVDLELHGATLAQRTGQTVGTIQRPEGDERKPRQLDAYLPPDVAVRSTPKTADRSTLTIRLRGRKGEYTPLTVFPNDSRKLLADHSWPWNLTGLVTTSDGTSGSGVLVGDRLMLCAHHMRPGNSIGRGNWWMTFAPNYDSGNMPFGSTNVSDLRHYDTESDLEYTVGHDFMLCRLYDPLGKRLGYLGSTTFDDGWRGMNVWNNIGYPIDVGGGHRPAVQIKQSMEDDYEDDGAQYLETEASLNNGNSGGPFFSWFTDHQVRLCGVVSGGLTFNGDRDNAAAGGEDMVHLIDWGRANWRA